MFAVSHRIATAALALAGLCHAPAQAQAGHATLNLTANAYHDRLSQEWLGDGATPIGGTLLAKDETGDIGVNFDYGSRQWAQADGLVSASVVALSSRVQAWTRSTGVSYSASAGAMAQALVQVPFLVAATTSAPAGTKGTMVVPLWISGELWADDPLSNLANSLELRGEARFHAWATGLQATGCPDQPGAACMNIMANADGKVVTGNAPFRTWTLNIPFTFGAWGSYTLQMWTSADAYANAPGDGTWQQYDAWSDAAHSMRWGGIQQILNAQGQAVTGWTVQSLPGVDLTVSSVPEPPPAMLWLAGLGLAVRVVRRRARHTPPG